MNLRHSILALGAIALGIAGYTAPAAAKPISSAIAVPVAADNVVEVGSHREAHRKFRHHRHKAHGKFKHRRHGLRVHSKRGFYRHQGRHYYNGYRGIRYGRHGYRNYRGYWFPRAAFRVQVRVRPHYRTAPRPLPRARIIHLPAQHVAWCQGRYKSYRIRDNSFQPYHGRRKACRSPYAR